MKTYTIKDIQHIYDEIYNEFATDWILIEEDINKVFKKYGVKLHEN